jgi:hypothetical protein
MRVARRKGDLRVIVLKHQLSIASFMSQNGLGWTKSDHADYAGQPVIVTADAGLKPPLNKDETLMLVEGAKKVFDPTFFPATPTDPFSTSKSRLNRIHLCSRRSIYVTFKIGEPSTILISCVTFRCCAHRSLSRQYGMVGIFPKPFEMEGKPLVLQYEVKLTKGQSCGGNASRVRMCAVVRLCSFMFAALHSHASLCVDTCKRRSGRAVTGGCGGWWW